MFLYKSGAICEDTPRCERIPGATKGIVPLLFSEPIISDRNETERETHLIVYNTCVFNISSKMTRIDICYLVFHPNNRQVLSSIQIRNVCEIECYQIHASIFSARLNFVLSFL